MKRIFYSIGLVFAIFFLSCGFFLSYQLTSLRDRMNRLEQESALMGKQVSANPFSRDSDYVFESFDSDTAKLVKERYRVSSYADDQVVLRRSLAMCPHPFRRHAICVLWKTAAWSFIWKMERKSSSTRTSLWKHCQARNRRRCWEAKKSLGT